MSGSTVVRQRGKYYEIELATPCMNFAMDPDREPGTPTYEQQYHASAKQGFEAELAPLAPALDEALPGLAAAHPGVTFIPLSEELPLVNGHYEGSLREHRQQGRRACRVNRLLRCEAPPLNMGTLTLALAALPDDEALERLFAAASRLIDHIRGEHLRKLADLERHGPPRAGAFHDRDLPAAGGRNRPDSCWRGRQRRVIRRAILGLLVVAAVAAVAVLLSR